MLATRDEPTESGPAPVTPETPAAPESRQPQKRRPRIAYLSYSTAEFDSRTQRMARSAIEAGYDVVVYARWQPGVPPTEERDGYRIIRVPFDWRLAFPIWRRRAMRRQKARMADPENHVPKPDLLPLDGGTDGSEQADAAAADEADAAAAADAGEAPTDQVEAPDVEAGSVDAPAAVATELDGAPVDAAAASGAAETASGIPALDAVTESPMAVRRRKRATFLWRTTRRLPRPLRRPALRALRPLRAIVRPVWRLVRKPSRSSRPSRPSRPVRRTSPELSRTIRGKIDQFRRQAILFPFRPMGWAYALEEVVEPADVWHGMWAGSLPAQVRLRKRFGGRTIYDSRDVYMHARTFGTMGPTMRRVFEILERRWAQAADTVLTVNEAYASILERSLRVPRPPIVMNCPQRWTPPSPRPNLLREALGLDDATRIVLYQGNLMTERGVEESMDAILDVPNTVLALLGYGPQRRTYAERAAVPPYAGKVFVLPAVPPSELLTWTASADVLIMAIQPTTLNHRYTTPQKLFEACAAGVPVVASDLPGMAEVVNASGSGVLCDPTSPADIAAALRRVLDAPPEERAAWSEAALRAAHATYNWETQVETLLDVYRRLVAAGRG